MPTKTKTTIDSSLRVAVKQIGTRAVKVVQRAAGDGPWTEDAILRASGLLVTGAKEGGLQRPWPNLAARLRKLVATRETKPETEIVESTATAPTTPTTPTTKATAKNTTPDAKPQPTAPTKRDFASGGVELADIAERFLKHLEKSGKSRGTVFSYSLDLGVAERHFGANRDAATITTDEVAEYFESAAVTKNRSGGSKNAITIAKLRRTLRMALVWAAEEKLLAVAPIPVTAKVKEAADAAGLAHDDEKPAPKAKRGRPARNGANDATPTAIAMPTTPTAPSAV